MKKLLGIVVLGLLLFLSSCSESEEKKDRRVKCERYTSELNADLNECIKNDKKYSELR